VLDLAALGERLGRHRAPHEVRKLSRLEVT